jgi:uracil-DNA glycosylase
VALRDGIPDEWAEALAPALASPWFAELAAFVAAERAAHPVYPPPEDVFSALRLTSLADTRVLLLGQDPYHGPGQAHGLSFSVRRGVKIPPSLRNMFKEREADVGVAPGLHGDLSAWATQGVLMLNAVLTVRHKKAGSHAKKGWEKLTDEIIRAVDARSEPAVFLLWGNYARKKTRLIDPRHTVIESTHPSPLSAHNGWWGSRPFSKVNAALSTLGEAPIDW